MQVQRQRHRERLENRSRLEDVGEHTVAQLLTRQVLTVVRVVGRQVGQRQHLSGLRVDNDRHRSLRPGTIQRILQCLVRDVLHASVQRQTNVLAVARWTGVVEILNRSADAILDHSPYARRAFEQWLLAQLHTFLSLVLDVGKADHVRGHFTFGIEALVFTTLIYAGNAQRFDLLADLRRDLALYIDELFLADELGAQFFCGDVEQLAGLLDVAVGKVVRHFGRDGPNGAHRQTGREHTAITIFNLAPNSRHDDGVLVTLFTLRDVETVARPGNPECPDDQPDEGDRDDDDDEFGAP
ncbi:hypothetical protein PAN31117_04528 [Pandoraea anapnoica]|uniref:Uncharacterized protein n=1 Tax=Pandoraea anapnoica TaxID=2508301 RepID=A0A5E5AGQ8_9BURK|nr:hypothetical protein PAN31117_04528 [Pandoraea anapnoica]